MSLPVTYMQLVHEPTQETEASVYSIKVAKQDDKLDFMIPVSLFDSVIRELEATHECGIQYLILVE